MFLKRTFDILISLIGLIISFPIWLLCALAIAIESGSPIFIKQERIGKNGKIFHVIKFRSMDKTAHKECPGSHDFKERDQRVTKVGKIIRKTAIDELPQLLSIFLGDMSFVGPRPIHPSAGLIGSKYGKLEEVLDFGKRCSMIPGLTGIAQIYARKDSALEEKIKYDLLYIKRHNLLLDLKLFLLSFWVTFRGKWEKDEKKL